MHFLYVDEAGHSGTNLEDEEQPVFVMAGVVVSDEKWQNTRRRVNVVLTDYLGEEPDESFELHAHELLSPEGNGPFVGWSRERRNQLALDVLDVIGERSHQILIHWIYKQKLSQLTGLREYGFYWKDPWEHSFHALLTMFEEFLRSPQTGTSSTGLAIADHSEPALEAVRSVSSSRRRLGGWRRLKKIVEIGYSAESHANRMLQLADLVSYTMKKWAETEIPFGQEWPEPARTFYSDCRSKVWARTKLKTIVGNQLNIPDPYRETLLSVRKPGT